MKFAGTKRHSQPLLIGLALTMFLGAPACAPRVVDMKPLRGMPGDTVSLSMEYLVGWPRVEIGTVMMDWPQLRLQAADGNRKDVPGEELIWIEDKILHFKIPELAPGDLIYSFLETSAYLAFPPVWPFVLRSNRAQVDLRVLPKN